MSNVHPKAMANNDTFPASNNTIKLTIPTKEEEEQAQREYEIYKNNAKAPVIRKAHRNALTSLAENAKDRLNAIQKARIAVTITNDDDDYSLQYPIEKYPLPDVRASFIELDKAMDIWSNALKQKNEVLKKYNLPEDWRG